MVFYRTISWETSLDIAGIFLCCLIIIYLLYNKIKYRRLLIDASLIEPGTVFKADVTQQMVKQQAERILYLISGPLANELMVLKEMAPAGSIMSDGTRIRAPESWASQGSDTQSGLLDPPPVGFEHDPYVEVTRLSQDGLNPHQIAEKVKLPLGEIELLLKLHESRL
jgi:hypothetical protein